MYRFDWPSRFAEGAFGSCHTIDLPFVFGTTDGDEKYAEFFNLDSEADRLSEAMMDSWLAFARTGDPSHSGLPDGQWPSWHPEQRVTMIFGKEIVIEEDPQGITRQAWDGLI